MSKIRAQLPTIRFLQSTLANDAGDVVPVALESAAGDVYYYDSLHRYCYLTAGEEGTAWEWVQRYPSRVSDGNGEENGINQE
jgi:hypothetical protein